MKCEYCDSELKELFTSTYCPNDCDKKSSLSNIDWGKALLELKTAIDSWKSLPSLILISEHQDSIWPWPDTEE